ncbi:hypothetical protein A1F94_011986 [Pyrenophora tritici-repentis]|nr:hypothetical protein A1F94_011986 [Pyrenophora tritici-repentis]KAI0579810.1 hypothetical protein Alg215_05555 [Pyrenophora tritici-repentis]KAI0585208.1 hypothetical protein Alg130_04848 [Pyrenophora tritici-repentis]KAI0610933.1 hypothetical protein TUN205_04806 [Pyrenophora tritici-repentis]KAI0623058.1 hypothetical protein TUN199_04961 [Pyrenophora tritici-repentis]
MKICIRAVEYKPAQVVEQGEERIRPRKGTFYGVQENPNGFSLQELELFGMFNMTSKAEEATQPDLQITTVVSREHWINTATHLRAGTVKFDTGYDANRAISVTAILLSEAQYLGNETRPDVLGYPFYNIMLVETAPAFPRPEAGDVFRLVSLATGTALQNGNVQAKEGSLVINSPDQTNKTCAVNGDRENTTSGIDFASFTLNQDDGSVYIYTFNPPLQLYVDRSGMGMGNVRYSTGVQPIGKNQERGPFKIDDRGDLVFAAGGLTGDVGFQACPGAVGGGWKIWLSGVAKPAGSEGCLPVTLRASKEDEPKKCLYSSAPA